MDVDSHSSNCSSDEDDEAAHPSWLTPTITAMSDEDDEAAHPSLLTPTITATDACQEEARALPPQPHPTASNNAQDKQQPGPATASAPVTSHFDALLECLDMLRLMEEDNDNITKQDVIDSMRSMLHNMLSTVMMHNFSTSMSVKGWRVE
jgi:hypothetical protein